MNVTFDLLKMVAQQAAISAYEMMGINAVLSYTQGVAKYGKFFKDMVEAGRIHPRYSGKGATGKRMYAVKDILALMSEESAKAEIAQ